MDQNTENVSCNDGGDVEDSSSTDLLEIVYELVDSTNEDAYYSLGLFATLQEALKVATMGEEPCGYDPEEYCQLTIRERSFGKLDRSSGGKVIHEIQWKQEINDEGEWEWELVKPLQSF